MNSAFEALAALGTQRLQTPPPPPHELLTASWQGLDWSSPERALLRGAALMAAARTAGQLSTTGATVPAASPDDTLPRLPEIAAQTLRVLLAGEFVECLPEFLARAANCGFRCAHRDLPALLHRALASTSLRSEAMQVAAARGTWLAEQNPDWQNLTKYAAVPSEAFDTGTAEQRVAWLRQMRQQDLAVATRALTETWKQETGEQREQLLTVVAADPQPSDEPILMLALADRRREVRQMARAALRRLPTAQVTQHAMARLHDLVQAVGRGTAIQLTVTLPEAYRPEWRSLGIDEKPPQGTGAKAFWARQLLAAIPLAHWPRAFGLSAEALFLANRDAESRDVLWLAWSDAAGDCADDTAVTAFALALFAEEHRPTQLADPTAVVTTALRAAPGAFARFFAHKTAWQSTRAPAAQQQLLPAERIAFAFDQVLPDACGDQLLAHLLDGWRRGVQRFAAAQSRHLAARFPAASCSTALRDLNTLSTPTSDAESFVRMIEFRSSYLDALPSHATP
jgi:hypothetical protein